MSAPSFSYCLQADSEGNSRPLMLPQVDNVIHTQFPCYLGSAVSGAVAHYQHLYPRQRTGEIIDGLGEGGFFVIGRDLDDEFHSQKDQLGWHAVHH